MRGLALIPLLALASSLYVQRADAQRAVGRGFGAAHHHAGYGYTPAPFSYDPLLYDALYREGYPVASQPPVIVVQPAASDRSQSIAPAAQAPAQPLMIELQGDRYVRVSGEESSTAEMISPRKPDAEHPSSHTARSTSAARATTTAPAVLVFRDGRRQEVSDYTIVDGALYTRANYYTGGSWNQKIELRSLNISETIAANQTRGVNFQLPTSPNEVMIRP
jgi:hypothetical protein